MASTKENLSNGEVKRLCVIIVNYRTAVLTLDCIDTLVEQINHSCDHIVVVDNKSGEDDLTMLDAAIKQKGLAGLITLIPSSTNGGFSAGNNIGIKALQAEYYLLANADTLFSPTAINQLLLAIKEYPHVGILSPRLEWPDEQPQISCFHFHSPLSELINSASTWPITRMFKKYDVPLRVRQEVTWPEWTSFACVLIKRNVFKKIGYLDEGYFMYYEDVDFCRRAKKAGFALLNWPSARVVHLRGQSSGLKKKQREQKRLPEYYYKSRSRYFIKFYTVVGWWSSNICWLAGRTLSWTKELLLRRKRSVPEYQFVDIWKR